MTRRLRFAALTCLLGLAGSARAQVLTDPNQVVGSFRWTNTNPEIRSVLDRRALSDRYRYRLSAESVGRDPVLTAAASGSDRNREIPVWEISVESDPAGLVHELTGQVYDRGHDRYWFAPKTSAPVFPEPAPDVVLEFAECAGGFRLLLPAGLEGGLAEAWLETAEGGRQALREFDEPGATETLLLVRGGETYELDVTFLTGTDPQLDLLRWELEFEGLAVACDEIVEIDARGSAGGPLELGRITGEFDVLGERELWLDSETAPLSRVGATAGPWLNSRFDSFESDPSVGAFDLVNVMPSTVTVPAQPYDVQARAVLSGGITFAGPVLPVSVGEAELVELGDLFVFRPGRVAGAVSLTGPPEEGPLGSPLRWIRTLTPPGDPDWLPPGGRLSGTVITVTGTSETPPGATRPSAGASFVVEPRGGWLPASASWGGDYDLPVAALGREPGRFDVSALSLKFEGPNDPGEPDAWIESTIGLSDELLGSRTVAPDEVLTVDRGYCLSEVAIGFTTLSGSLFRPHVFVEGELRGRGPAGAWREYVVDGSARGTPSGWVERAPTGQVIAALPAGRLVLAPSLTHVSDSDQETHLTLDPIPLTLGCRQRLELQPELSLSIGLDDVPPCAEAGTITLSGTVRSDEAVASVTVAVNAGAPRLLCNDCGISPAFEGEVEIEDGGNELVVVATDASGRSASVRAWSRHAREPSALDRRPGDPPLRVARSGSRLELSWQDFGPANLHAGSLDGLWASAAYDHAGLGDCDRVGGAASFAPEGGNRYYLVTSPCDWGDGSFGRDSAGRERPGSLRACD